MNIEILEPMIDEIEELHSQIINTIKNCYTEYYPKEAVDFFISYSNKNEITSDLNSHLVVVAKSNNEIVGTGT